MTTIKLSLFHEIPGTLHCTVHCIKIENYKTDFSSLVFKVVIQAFKNVKLKNRVIKT